MKPALAYGAIVVAGSVIALGVAFSGKSSGDDAHTFDSSHAEACVENHNRVTQVSGIPLVHGNDGKAKLLPGNSTETRGDTLTAEKDSFALVRLNDGSLVTVKPNTRVLNDVAKIDEEKWSEDTIIPRTFKSAWKWVSRDAGQHSDCNPGAESAAETQVVGSVPPNLGGNADSSHVH